MQYAFYKILVDVTESGGVRVLAFIMPQVASEDGVSVYLVSVDEIEGATGLDFLSLLDDGTEDQLEAGKAARLW